MATVGELIEQLQKFKPEQIVISEGCDDCWWEPEPYEDELGQVKI